MSDGVEHVMPGGSQTQTRQEMLSNAVYVEFSGTIKYVLEYPDCALAADDLLKMANECTEETFVVGFDMEWPVTLPTMQDGKTALIQISPNYEICHLLHVSEITRLPKVLKEFLQHPKVRLTGVNISNDIRKLCQDFPGFDLGILLEKCLELGALGNSVLPIRRRFWSMERLVNLVLRMNINKDKRLRMSEWDLMPLKEEQLKYAATDAYVSLRLYREMTELRNSGNRVVLNFNPFLR